MNRLCRYAQPSLEHSPQQLQPTLATSSTKKKRFLTFLLASLTLLTILTLSLLLSVFLPASVSSGEEFQGIAPTVSNAPNNYTVITMNAGANFANTLRDNPGNLVLALNANFNWSSALEVSGNRHVIITSAGTNLNDHSRPGTPFTINHTGASGRLFWIDNGARLTVSNVTLNGNVATGGTQRGGVFIDEGSTFVMENGSTILNSNSRTLQSMGTPSISGQIGGGGGVRVRGGTLIMEEGSLVTHNRAVFGSGVRADSGATVIINGGAINDNGELDSGHGGGIQIEDSGTTLTMNDGEISRNIVSSRGGGVRVLDAEFNMYDGTISNNASFASVPADRAGGGGVYVGIGTFNMHGGTVEDNHSMIGGGVLSPWAEGEVNLYGGNIRNNITQAESNDIILEGGGIWAAENTLNMYGGTIEGNHAVRGGGVHATDGEVFTMFGGTIEGNTADEGGGVWAGNDAEFYMETGGSPENPTSGTIIRNTSEGPTGRSGGGGVFAVHNATIEMNDGLIEENSAIVRGGGINFHSSQGSISGGIIRGNTVSSGNGGGIHITQGSSLDIFGGEIVGNSASNAGGGVFTFTNPINMHGGIVSGNTAVNSGGGFGVGGVGGVLNLLGQNEKIITGNSADLGGGIHVAQNASLNATSGSIIDNLAGDGGGLFVPHANLDNITIEPGVIFDENMAWRGLHVDTPLANAQYPRISPGTVSIENIPVIYEHPQGSGDFDFIAFDHAFTNFDINANGLPFWRVTYEVGTGYGEIDVAVGRNGLPVPNGAFVAPSAPLTFNAGPEGQFIDWEVYTKTSKIDPSGGYVDFVFEGNDDTNPLLRPIVAHNHIVGNFLSETTLTISKTVTGDFGDKLQGFEFTISFTDSNGDPLPEDTKLDYVGTIIANSGATIPQDGSLTLDSAGSAQFHLQHGQGIEIAGVSLNGFVQVIETKEAGYRTSIIDNKNEADPISGTDTSVLAMAIHRNLNFINDRPMPPFTGLDLGNTGTMLLVPALALCPIVGVPILRKARLQKKEISRM